MDDGNSDLDTTMSHPLPELAESIDTDLQTIPLNRRLQLLVDHYFAPDQLTDRLQDLPRQFDNPQPRPWKPIHWSAITSDQIIGMKPDLFLAVLKGAIDTEAPIRGYTQTSRQYLTPLDARMARFVGGVVDAEGHLLAPGLWEKEERQHTPALIKLYAQLTQQNVQPAPHTVRDYRPSDQPIADLYRHGLHRIATEYGAACLYLWLMAHTTGSLQAVLEELVLDEINHMTKFWGFGLWAYPDSSLQRIGWTLLQTMQGRLTYDRDRSSLVGTLHRMSTVLNWPAWSWANRATFAWTCVYALNYLWKWSNGLSQNYLHELFDLSGEY